MDDCDRIWLPIIKHQSMLEEAKQNFLTLWTRPSQARNVTLAQFDLIRVLGKGTYGKVFYARYKPNGIVVALKVQSKRSVIRRDSVTSVIAEKHIQSCIKFEFIVQLLFHFKDNVNLYLALEFLGGGDFFHHLRNRDKLIEDHARFYASNVFLALEFLHGVDILFRDLKPENILMDSIGYLKLADFGLAKRCAGKTYSLCGTPEYLAPEIVSLRPYGKSIDIWAFGIFIYEMLFAKTPFIANDYRQMCHKICKDAVNIDATCLSESGKSLIEALLAKKPSRRIGVTTGISDVRNHEWFSYISWTSLYERSVKAPYVANQAEPEREMIHFPGAGDYNEDLYAAEFADF